MVRHARKLLFMLRITILKVILNLYGTEYLIENMIMRKLLIRWLILGHGALYQNQYRYLLGNSRKQGSYARGQPTINSDYFVNQ